MESKFTAKFREKMAITGPLLVQTNAGGTELKRICKGQLLNKLDHRASWKWCVRVVSSISSAINVVYNSVGSAVLLCPLALVVPSTMARNTLHAIITSKTRDGVEKAPLRMDETGAADMTDARSDRPTVALR